MKRKIVGILINMLLMISCITVILPVEIAKSSGNTLYVGGSGSGNYTYEGIYTINSSVISISYMYMDITNNYNWSYEYLSEDVLQIKFTTYPNAEEITEILDRQ